MPLIWPEWGSGPKRKCSCVFAYCWHPGRHTGCSMRARQQTIRKMELRGRWGSGYIPHQLHTMVIPAVMDIRIRFSLVSLVTEDLLGGTYSIRCGQVSSCWSGTCSSHTLIFSLLWILLWISWKIPVLSYSIICSFSVCGTLASCLSLCVVSYIIVHTPPISTMYSIFTFILIYI